MTSPETKEQKKSPTATPLEELVRENPDLPVSMAILRAKLENWLDHHKEQLTLSHITVRFQDSDRRNYIRNYNGNELLEAVGYEALMQKANSIEDIVEYTKRLRGLAEKQDNELFDANYEKMMKGVSEILKNNDFPTFIDDDVINNPIDYKNCTDDKIQVANIIRDACIVLLRDLKRQR
jgi:hypothetical protein